MAAATPFLGLLLGGDSGLTNFGAATSVFKLLAAPPSSRARVSCVGWIFMKGDTRDVHTTGKNPRSNRFWGWAKVQLGILGVLGLVGLGFGPWPLLGVNSD